ncbi:MAG: hypothetical protein GY730_03160 [bacterium]|nr:hypothetical protein [bacterium]
MNKLISLRKNQGPLIINDYNEYESNIYKDNISSGNKSTASIFSVKDSYEYNLARCRSLVSGYVHYFNDKSEGNDVNLPDDIITVLSTYLYFSLAKIADAMNKDLQTWSDNFNQVFNQGDLSKEKSLSFYFEFKDPEIIFKIRLKLNLARFLNDTMKIYPVYCRFITYLENMSNSKNSNKSYDYGAFAKLPSSKTEKNGLEKQGLKMPVSGNINANESSKDISQNTGFENQSILQQPHDLFNQEIETASTSQSLKLSLTALLSLNYLFIDRAPEYQSNYTQMISSIMSMFSTFSLQKYLPDTLKLFGDKFMNTHPVTDIELLDNKFNTKSFIKQINDNINQFYFYNTSISNPRLKCEQILIWSYSPVNFKLTFQSAGECERDTFKLDTFYNSLIKNNRYSKARTHRSRLTMSNMERAYLYAPHDIKIADMLLIVSNCSKKEPVFRNMRNSSYIMKVMGIEEKNSR